MSWLEGVPRSWLEAVPVSWLEGVRVSWLEVVLWSWLETVLGSWMEDGCARWFEALPGCWFEDDQESRLEDGSGFRQACELESPVVAERRGRQESLPRRVLATVPAAPATPVVSEETVLLGDMTPPAGLDARQEEDAGKEDADTILLKVAPEMVPTVGLELEAQDVMAILTGAVSGRTVPEAVLGIELVAVPEIGPRIALAAVPGRLYWRLYWKFHRRSYRRLRRRRGWNLKR